MTSTISWTDQTWNMIHAINLATGKRGWHCEHVTEACRNCYAETLNMRAGDSGGTGLAYKPGHRKDLDIFLNEDALRKPLHWRAPRKIFVCSMTDLGASFVPDEWLNRIFAVAALCPHHKFQMLSKRPDRLRAYLSEPATQARICAAMWDISKGRTDHMHGGWPLRNVWIGTSICDQADADKFVPELLHTPAAIRFLSCEPLLGMIDLSRGLAISWKCSYCREYFSGNHKPSCPSCGQLGGWTGSHPFNGRHRLGRPYAQRGSGLDMVICGGESGKDARPMHPDWARSLRDQCADAGVPFHFKQWGEFRTSISGRAVAVDGFDLGSLEFHEVCSRPGVAWMDRVGVRKAGRQLDGIEHNDMPGVLA